MAVTRHSAFLRRLAWLGASRGPFWVLRYSPPVVGWTAAVLSKDARRRVVANLHLVRGPAPPWRDAVDTMRTFASFAGALGESLATGSKNERPLEPSIEGGEHLRAVLGGPFIIGTIHSGGWDVLGALLTGDLALDMVIVMAHEADAAAERLHDEVRGKARVRVVHVGNDALDALPLLGHLRGGGVVAMQLDRTPPGMRTVPARLFDAGSALPEGPFRLARLTGAPILPIFCARVGFRRYRIVIHEPIRLGRRDPPESTALAAQSIADRVTAFLRAHPSQWFNF
ncbi:MAG: lysophospholipid acyltransferase family protein [Labilithrix sp.]|nr:lysophospholipid acyltransferase family protein [Labilithrix sp.]